jgi:hypothetical protein
METFFVAKVSIHLFFHLCKVPVVYTGSFWIIFGDGKKFFNQGLFAKGAVSLEEGGAVFPSGFIDNCPDCHYRLRHLLGGYHGG